MIKVGENLERTRSVLKSWGERGVRRKGKDTSGNKIGEVRRKTLGESARFFDELGTESMGVDLNVL